MGIFSQEIIKINAPLWGVMSHFKASTLQTLSWYVNNSNAFIFFYQNEEREISIKWRWFSAIIMSAKDILQPYTVVDVSTRDPCRLVLVVTHFFGAILTPILLIPWSI